MVIIMVIENSFALLITTGTAEGDEEGMRKCRGKGGRVRVNTYTLERKYSVDSVCLSEPWNVGHEGTRGGRREGEGRGVCC